MRRYITIAASRRGGEPEVRLYEMGQAQRELYDAVARRLAESGKCTPLQATQVVERAVVARLQGHRVSRGAPRIFAELARAFPPLRDADVAALPVLGCPDGDVEAILLPMRARDGTTRTARYDLDPDQQRWHAEAMRRACIVKGESRDEAWLNVNQLIGRLLAGGRLLPDAEFIVQIAAGYFPALSAEQALALPEATEDDVRRLSFRDVRPKGAGRLQPPTTRDGE